MTALWALAGGWPLSLRLTPQTETTGLPLLTT